MGYLRIGELSARTGTNNETLRFYESKGLMSEPQRSEKGYRLYKEEDVRQVGFIVRAKRMGFSLKEIGELLSLRVEREQSTCADVKELAETKLADIDQKMAELKRMRNALQQITDACCGADVPADNCSILNALEDSA